MKHDWGRVMRPFLFWEMIRAMKENRKTEIHLSRRDECVRLARENFREYLYLKRLDRGRGAYPELELAARSCLRWMDEARRSKLAALGIDCSFRENPRAVLRGVSRARQETGKTI